TGRPRDLRVFFFQAEDGIRDFHVTGVQTCALPIFSPASSVFRRETEPFTVRKLVSVPPSQRWVMYGMPQRSASSLIASRALRLRSEERRVGKEGRPGAGR